MGRTKGLTLAQRAKLDEGRVVELRRRLAAGEALRALARESGLDRKTLMAMRDGKTWAHVPVFQKAA